MPINRDLQRRVLEKLATIYPAKSTDIQAVQYGVEEEVMAAQLAYLEEYDLLKCEWSNAVSRRTPKAVFARITAKGLDFLQDDGGLGAILGTVTIKLHDDTIKHLIGARIEAADIPEPEKKELLDQLRELPAETTKHVVLKLLDKAFEAAPQAIQWLETILRSLG